MARFDFNAAVAAALRDYPEETAHTAFIDINARGGRAHLREFARKLYMRDKGVSEEETHTLAAKLKIRMNAMGMSHAARKSQGAISYYADHETNALLIRAGLLKTFIRAPFLLLQFNHELGHIVVPNGHARERTGHEQERAADCFSAMRMLAQGKMSLGDIRGFANFRENGWSSMHNTSAALTDLAKNMKGIEKSSLTPKKVKSKANAYGPKPS